MIGTGTVLLTSRSLWVSDYNKEIAAGTGTSVVAIATPPVPVEPQVFHPYQLSDEEQMPVTRVFRALAEEQDTIKRELKITTWIDEQSPEEIPGLLQDLSACFPEELSGELKERLIRRWAEASPADAASWAEHMSELPTRYKLMEGVAIVWANQDPAAASRWAQRITDAPAYNVVMSSVAYEAARSQPLLALELAVQLPIGSNQDELVSHTTRQWALLDPAAAAGWAQSLPKTEFRLRILSELAVQQGETDPVAAIGFALEFITAGSELDDAVVGIVQRWAQADPAQTAKWVGEFPAGALRDASVGNLVRLWTKREWDAPAKWINTLPVGELKDHAIETFASEAAITEPLMALAWMETIADPIRRSRCFESLLTLNN